MVLRCARHTKFVNDDGAPTCERGISNRGAVFLLLNGNRSGRLTGGHKTTVETIRYIDAWMNVTHPDG
jgi:hypothetical protein